MPDKKSHDDVVRIRDVLPPIVVDAILASGCLGQMLQPPYLIGPLSAAAPL